VAVGHRLEFCRWMSAHRRLAHCILTRNEHHISEMAWTARWTSVLGIVEICAEDSKATSSKVLLYICGLLSMEICWPDRTYSRPGWHVKFTLFSENELPALLHNTPFHTHRQVYYQISRPFL
jgi:hypothetical protein